MTRAFQFSAPPCRQSGVVLFVGLVMLLLLTLIGIAAMQVTVLQERMAGNFYVQHLGFENGEAVLASGRDTLMSNTSSYVTPLSLSPGNTLPWDTWITSEPTIPQTEMVLLYSPYSGGQSGGGNQGFNDLYNYSVSVVGGDASGQAKTALQGIYIYKSGQN